MEDPRCTDLMKLIGDCDKCVEQFESHRYLNMIRELEFAHVKEFYKDFKHRIYFEMGACPRLKICMDNYDENAINLTIPTELPLGYLRIDINHICRFVLKDVLSTMNICLLGYFCGHVTKRRLWRPIKFKHTACAQTSCTTGHSCWNDWNTGNYV